MAKVDMLGTGGTMSKDTFGKVFFRALLSPSTYGLQR